jgi:lipoprotein signal peptidase
VRGVQTAPGTSLNGVDEVSGSAVPQTPGAATGAGRRPGAPDRPRRIGLLVGVAVFVIAADVISKSIVVAKMANHPPIRLLGGLLTITLTRNGGAAFSIGTSMTIVFTAIALGVIIYILRAARNLRSIGWAIALGLLLGGATGNLLDRIFRAPAPFQGHVVDWIELPHWPVFNLADSSICCAGVLVVLLALRGIRLDGTKAVPADDPAPQATAAEPGAAEPQAAEPRAAEPQAAEPRAAEPRAAEPRAAEPRAAEPRAAESRAADDGR